MQRCGGSRFGMAEPTNAWSCKLTGGQSLGWAAQENKTGGQPKSSPTCARLSCCPVQPGTLDLVLLKRKGFVRVALEGGAALVPVLAFGENEQVSSMGGAMP